MEGNRIQSAINALEIIKQNDELSFLLKESDIDIIKDYSTDSENLFEFVDDRLETMDDFMLICGYSEKEAGVAYGNLLNY